MPRPTTILIAVNDTNLERFLPVPLRAQLEAIAENTVWFDPTDVAEAEWHAVVRDTNPDIVVGCWSTPALPAELPSRTRYYCYLAGSVRPKVTRAQIEQGLLVTDWGSSISRYIAEAALLHILSCLRNTRYWTTEMHVNRGWQADHGTTSTLFKRSVGIHGFGRIARELVKLLASFNCPISVFAPNVDEKNAPSLGVTASPSLEALFEQNDVVVELAPLNDATRGSVHATHFQLLSPGNVFVNVGRAGVTDEAALLAVAQAGKVMLGLDVYHEEPLAADSPLRGLRNVSLTPHNAGPTDDGGPSAGAFSVANLIAYAEDRPLQSVITPAVYDQST